MGTDTGKRWESTVRADIHRQRPCRFSGPVLQETYEVGNIQSQVLRIPFRSLCRLRENGRFGRPAESRADGGETGRCAPGTNTPILHSSRPARRFLMMEPSRKRTTQVGVYSALAGGALGFALGMLFAPQRGPDARRRVAYQLERLASQAEEVLRRLVQARGESPGRRNSDAVVQDAETRADHIRDDIDALMEELRSASQEHDASR